MSRGTGTTGTPSQGTGFHMLVVLVAHRLLHTPNGSTGTTSLVLWMLLFMVVIIADTLSV